MIIKNVYIVGINGNMGNRYRSVCQYLGISAVGSDKEGLNEIAAGNADGFIIATPTKRHLIDIRAVLKYEKPILCEKPLTTNVFALQKFEDENRPNCGLITMVNQYQYLVSKKSSGDTYYDYFKTGSDGLVWDCINIIGMADGPVMVHNNSPVWRCMINGQTLELTQMDFAYLNMVRAWAKNPEGNWHYAKTAHFKVVKLESGMMQ